MAGEIENSVLLSALDEPARKRVAQHCGQRIKDLRGGMTTWLEMRQRFSDQAADDFSYRKAGLSKDDTEPDGIFAEQNDSLNVVGGFADFLVARISDDILGSEPFFAVIPEGKNDKMLAEGLQKHSEWKLRQTDLKDGFDDAIRKAVDLGEGVLKLRWKKTVRNYERRVKVLVNKKSGRPILTREGDFLFEDEEIIVERAAVADGEEPDSSEILRIYPKDHPEINLNGKVLDYVEKAIWESETVYDNVSCRCLNHKDLVVSLLDPSLEEAGFVGHLFDIQYLDIQSTYKLPKRILGQLKSNGAERKSEGQKAVTQRGEGEDTDTTVLALENPRIQLCECYLDYPINGKLCRIMAVIAVEQEILLWADYLGNITPKGAMPFVPIRAWKSTENRWYGRGIFESCDKDQTHIDRCLNYVGLRNRHAADPIMGIHPEYLVGIHNSNDLPKGPGGAVILMPDRKLSEAIEIMAIPELDERTWDIMQLRIQMAQLRKGVAAAAQGGFVSLPQNTTATGIDAIMASGDVLARKPINEVKVGLQGALSMALKFIYANQNEDETFTYLEGEHPEIVTITADSVRNLDINVRIVMTRFQHRTMRENAQVAMQAVAQYIALMPPEREAMRPFLLQLLKSLGFDSADSLVAKPDTGAAEAVVAPAAL